MTKRKSEDQSNYYQRYKTNFIEKYGLGEWLRRRRESHRKYVEKNRDEINRRHREWEANHKEKVAKWKKDFKVKLRLEVLIHYGGNPPKCSCCGETRIEFLGIDHINNDGAEHRRKIGREAIYRWLKKNGYPEGYRVHCHNCNCSRGFYGYCPHEREMEVL